MNAFLYIFDHTFIHFKYICRFEFLVSICCVSFIIQVIFFFLRFPGKVPLKMTPYVKMVFSMVKDVANNMCPSRHLPQIHFETLLLEHENTYVTFGAIVPLYYRGWFSFSGRCLWPLSSMADDYVCLSVFSLLTNSLSFSFILNVVRREPTGADDLASVRLGFFNVKPQERVWIQDRILKKIKSQ